MVFQRRPNHRSLTSRPLMLVCSQRSCSMRLCRKKAWASTSASRRPRRAWRATTSRPTCCTCALQHFHHSWMVSLRTTSLTLLRMVSRFCSSQHCTPTAASLHGGCPRGEDQLRHRRPGRPGALRGGRGRLRGPRLPRAGRVLLDAGALAPREGRFTLARGALLSPAHPSLPPSRAQYEVNDGALASSNELTHTHTNIATTIARAGNAPQSKGSIRMCSTDVGTTWKTMPGNNLIRVSDQGELQTWHTKYNRWSMVFKPPPGPLGYSYFMHQGKRLAVHQVVALTFIGPPPEPNYTVDHIAKYDGDWKRERSDNRAINLRYATKAEQTLNRQKAQTRCDSRPVWIWRATDTRENAVRYTSCSAAAVRLSIDSANLRRAASGERPSSEGYKACFDVAYEKQKVADDEEFRLIREKFKVSQYGRMLSTRGGSFAYTPRPNKGAKYAMVGNGLPFHRLVAEAWPDIVGSKPSDLHTIDHIDRDTTNNYADNLRWATESEQKLNQSRKKKQETNARKKIAVEVLPLGSAQWMQYGSMHDAADSLSSMLGYKIRDSSLSAALTTTNLTYTFKRRAIKGWKIRRSA